jgi:phosphoribosyl 1,2-cyclic phosphodiesterase
MYIASLSSGSQGNAVFVSDDKGDIAFLIDCGIGVAVLRERLSLIDKSLNDINFVVLTHEHNDHIRSAEALSQVYNIPVYAQESVLRALCRYSDRKLKNLAMFKGFGGFSQSGFDIYPFETSHDVPTVGYSINNNGKQFVYATDLGVASPRLLETGKNADLVMLESNYDKEMLTNGSYPDFLKKRILSSRGHLSNGDCAQTISQFLNFGVKKFVLGHLSAENNTPMLALKETENALKTQGATIDKDYFIKVARQHAVTELIEI